MSIKKLLNESEYSEDRKKAIQDQKQNALKNNAKTGIRNDSWEGQMTEKKSNGKKKIVKKQKTMKIVDLKYPTVIIRINDDLLKKLGLDKEKNTRRDATNAILKKAGL